MRNNDPDFLENAYPHYVKTIPKRPYLKGIQFPLDMLATAGAAGEERQTGAVRRSQFSSGAREGGFLW
jgi:hypothetical protein